MVGLMAGLMVSPLRTALLFTRSNCLRLPPLNYVIVDEAWRSDLAQRGSVPEFWALEPHRMIPVELRTRLGGTYAA
ncbi:uncharacterized protein BO97DRAFT_402680 [Aspergillus homomorphus CBS 101889]|uniref:Uncharacterized protein n=1 Tax=Aspergillus homomorphus (strain CBS 101889) TaxID=1450537 RepID=A0A395IAQ5_ASPHC|nr:hypothetical protein BO97DRAFT_402680 [Aspergillus homomorphus CBS 101889]RAL16223.1 hypothetical protein BO97DRAFT_402680 [Aspergillus homomorphus CBS 101889]